MHNLNCFLTKHIITFFLKNKQPIVYPFLRKQIYKIAKQHFNELDDKKLNNAIHYAVKKLIKQNIIAENRISSRIRELELVDPKAAVDLIAKADARNHQQHSQFPKQTIILPSSAKVSAEDYLLPRFARMNEHYYKIASRYFKTPPSKINNNDKSNITAAFEIYISDISERILLFKTPYDTIETKNYKSRFISKHEIISRLKTFEQAFELAKQQYDTAIFLTITLPPIFPLKLSQWILSFIFHRIKAILRKWHGETLPHVKVLEPQNNFNPHIHSIIFGTGFLMEKKRFTKWLDEQLQNFLANLGEHYKKTINKRADEQDVKLLNRFGKKMLKRYKRYKAKQYKKTKRSNKKEKYEGPINHITKVTIQNGDWTFVNPPPDASKLQSKQKTKYMHVSVVDYIKFYITSALFEAQENEKDPVRKQKPELAFYWLLRIPFYYISPKLRIKKEKPPPSGWIFICSIYKQDLPQLLSLL